MRDRMTKFLLVVIALALWGLLFKSLLAPAPVEAQGKAAKEVRARAFVLVDNKGKKWASLLMFSDGTPVLAFFDAKGKTRAGLLVRPTGSTALALRDAKGETRALLLVLPDGSPVLELCDEKGKPIFTAP